MRRLQSPAAEQLPERRLAAGKRGDRAHVQGTGGRTREAFAQKALTSARTLWLLERERENTASFPSFGGYRLQLTT